MSLRILSEDEGRRKKQFEKLQVSSRRIRSKFSGTSLRTDKAASQVGGAIRVVEAKRKIQFAFTKLAETHSMTD